MNEQWIRRELGTLYGGRVVREVEQINRLYDIYEGRGQDWQTAEGLSYRPNKTVTNYVKKLIKAEARFFASRAPEIRFVPRSGADAAACAQMDAMLTRVLDESRFRAKLIKAARDCFIGKRVALKLSGGPGEPLRVDFRPAQEFVFDTLEDDAGVLRKIIFFYQLAQERVEEYDRRRQRVWCQKYELRSGRCYLSQGLFDGNGTPVSDQNLVDWDTGLSFIPCTVILNDGLTGDVSGESDVEALISNQHTYNHMNSDDADALRFNMFPMRYTVDASAQSAQSLVIAPGAYADLATDPSCTEGRASIGILESQFNYDARLENRLNRTKNDMHDLLSVPNVSLEQLRGLAQSGKGMRALYWELRCRCEEKWAEGWDDALRWMAVSLAAMASAYRHAPPLPPECYTVRVDHLYPIPEDEEEERANDLQEVRAGVRSRQSYLEKWHDGDVQQELRQLDQDTNSREAAGKETKP